MKARVKPMTPGIPQAARIRAYLATLVVGVGLAGVVYRAWALQIDDGDRYRALAARQHAMTIEIPAPRGDVLDAHGRPLAVSALADSIWADPRAINDVTATAETLAKLIGGDAGALEAKLAGDHRFVWLVRHVSPETARAVREAKLAGVEVAREPRRWYPARTIGGPVIGRADIDGNGLDGIELAMNDLLSGRRAAIRALRDVRGRAMLADGLAQAEPGATVQLTLDRSIQAITDAALADAVTANKAKSGVVVVLDVPTGRVLALASYPTYDPNGDVRVKDGARDRPVTDVFEAGSVMKIFTVATALDAGIVKPDTEFDLHGGSLMLKGRPRPITDVHPDPYLTVAGIIKRSSNVGAAEIALKMGKDTLYTGLKRFGFGTKTGIELPGEQAGTVRDGAKWRDTELATIAYGYGVTVTPLQVAAGLAAIGNHGLRIEPRIVDQVIDGDGSVLYRAQPEQHRVVSEQVAAQMLPILASVFDTGKQHGTAWQIVVPGYKCGGKTGTAYKYDPETKKYASDRYLASFAGLAPFDRPRLAIVVMIDEPNSGDHFGASVAGPVFARIASEALRYLGAPGQPLPPAQPAADGESPAVAAPPPPP